jgi:hypothetical protein
VHECVNLKEGQIIRCTVLHPSWDNDHRNMIPKGQVWWGRYDENVDIGWLGRDVDTAVGVGFDKYELFTEDNVPDEYWAEVAKHALLGDDHEER